MEGGVSRLIILSLRVRKRTVQKPLVGQKPVGQTAVAECQAIAQNTWSKVTIIITWETLITGDLTSNGIITYMRLWFARKEKLVGDAATVSLTGVDGKLTVLPLQYVLGVLVTRLDALEKTLEILRRDIQATQRKAYRGSDDVMELLAKGNAKRKTMLRTGDVATPEEAE